jgi:hypothetical protein
MAPHGAAPKNNSRAAEVAMMNALVDIVIYIISICLICGLLLWFIDQAPIDEHSHRVARITIIVVAISLIISVLLSLVAGGPPHLRLR